MVNEIDNTKKFKKTRLIIVIAFALVFFLETKNNNIEISNEEKPEEKEVKEEWDTKEITSFDAILLLEDFQINADTITNYGITSKLEATYNYLIKKNKDKYIYDTCSNILKSEINTWNYENTGYLLKNKETYYCNNNNKHYVIPYYDYIDTLKKMFNERMKKDYPEFYYIKESDSIVYMPNRDGTNGPSTKVEYLSRVKVKNHDIIIDYFSERLACEAVNNETDQFINCGKNDFKVSGSAKEVNQEIMTKYYKELNHYKITLVDNKDYISFKSIEKQ